MKYCCKKLPFSIVRLCGFVVLMMVANFASAVVDVFDFSDQQQEARYQHFISVLRCPKCQNQNLAGSDSAIAGDLRKELFRLLAEGATDEEIVTFMTARYGDFVLYDPPVTKNTGLLWFLPLFILVAGVFLVIWRVRFRPAVEAVSSPNHSLSEMERKRLEALTQTGKDNG